MSNNQKWTNKKYIAVSPSTLRNIVRDSLGDALSAAKDRGMPAYVFEVSKDMESVVDLQTIPANVFNPNDSVARWISGAIEYNNVLN